jgi:hypothetical protein
MLNSNNNNNNILCLHFPQKTSAMHRPALPIEGLPAWAHLNGVSFHNIKVTNTEGKGYGVVSDENLEATETADVPPLLTVPHNLVLNAAAVEEYAKEDKNFRQLLDTVGRLVTESPTPMIYEPIN